MTHAGQENVTTLTKPVYPGYFADPFVMRLPNGHYAAFGTNPTATSGPRVFEALYSTNLRAWSSAGFVLDRLTPEMGDQYWAPEVAYAGQRWWLYYSLGHGDRGHHIRVASASDPFGPYRDLGINLTPGERFAIDPHPFQDADGSWYLYFSHDVLHHHRPGTHLAVAPLAAMTELGADPRPILAANADWQIYQRNRLMYGRRYNWHTLEGPSVIRRHDRYWMTYSGGAWTGPTYAISWATAPAPEGPWTHPANDVTPLLATTPELTGPGHNSIFQDGRGRDMIAFHAWNAQLTMRQLHIAALDFTDHRPSLDLNPPVS